MAVGPGTICVVVLVQVPHFVVKVYVPAARLLKTDPVPLTPLPLQVNIGGTTAGLAGGLHLQAPLISTVAPFSNFTSLALNSIPPLSQYEILPFTLKPEFNLESFETLKRLQSVPVDRTVAL